MDSSESIFKALPCYLVNNLTNSAERCQFIIDNDCSEEDSTFDYVYIVYCGIGYELRYVAILLIAFFVIVLFLVLSAVADEFLCPSLLTVAKSLRMSDSLAGVTLLAFGNGCPDIFASIAAASSGRPELILGELLGSGIFCTSVISGLILIHNEFRLYTRPLLRDVVFYILAVYLVWFFSWGGAISFYGSLAFIIIYVIYMTVVLSGQAIYARMQGNYVIRSGAAESAETLPTASQSAKEVSFVQSRTNKAFDKAENPEVIEIYAVPINSEIKRITSKAVPELRTLSGQAPTSLASEWDDFLTCVSPINSGNFRRAGLIGKVFQIIRAPLIFVANLTIPVVDREKRLNNWCRLLQTVQCVTFPLFMVATLKFDQNEAQILAVIPGFILAAYVFRTSSANQAPKYHSAFAYFGFAMSVLWIYMLATEIISLLKTVGIIFSMSDTAIGLGILAWGNSLGDIVSNLTLANAGYPKMALGATIGSPLLNLLMGFGLAFVLSLKPGEVSPIQYSPTITLLCSTLVTILILYMFSTLVSAERSRRPFGYLLICGYGVYFVIAVCIETGLIKFK